MTPGTAWPLPRRTVCFGWIELREWLSAAAGAGLDDAASVAAFEAAFTWFVGEAGAPAGPAAPDRTAVAFPSGRVALAAVLRALGLPAGSRVILAAYNDESVPEAIRRAGLEPRFVDVEDATQNLDPRRVKAALGRGTSAILATHLFGTACEIDEIAGIARREGLALVEDCAHALGVRHAGRPLGTFGDAAFFSFSPTKPHSTLGGGMAVAAGEETTRRLRAEQARLDAPRRAALVRAGAAAFVLAILTRPPVFGLTLFPVLFALRALGLDPIALYRATGGGAIRAGADVPARLTGQQARIGLAMLARVERETAERARLARRLREEIPAEIRTLPGEGARASGAYFFILSSPDPVRLARRLLLRGVDTGARVMRPCHAIFGAPGAFPATDAAYRQSVQVPLHAGMGEGTVERLARAIRLEWENEPGLFVCAGAGAGGETR